MYSEVNCLLLFIPHSNTTMTKRLKWGKFCVLCGPMYANSSEKKQKNERGFCVGRFLRRGPHNGKWMKSFSALKVLTQSAGHFNGSPNGRRAVWRWAAAPVCCRRARGSAAPHLDRRPVNFMLYLRTLHILCLPCQASFLPLIRRNEKYLTAAQISVISMWNRFRNGKTWGPAVATCRSHICSNYTWPQHRMTAERGERLLVGVGEHDEHTNVGIKSFLSVCFIFQRAHFRIIMTLSFNNRLMWLCLRRAAVCVIVFDI